MMTRGPRSLPKDFQVVSIFETEFGQFRLPRYLAVLLDEWTPCRRYRFDFIDNYGNFRSCFLREKLTQRAERMHQYMKDGVKRIYLDKRYKNADKIRLRVTKLLFEMNPRHFGFSEKEIDEAREYVDRDYEIFLESTSEAA